MVFNTINIDGKDVDIARTIKFKDDLNNKRVLEKFEVERRYWEKQGIDWGIVTEEEIIKDLAQNISYIHTYYNIDELDSFSNMEKRDIEDLVMEYIKRLIDGNVSVRQISNKFDDDSFLPKGTGVSLFKYLLMRKIIQIDLYAPIDINKKIQVNLVSEELDQEWNIS